MNYDYEELVLKMMGKTEEESEEILNNGDIEQLIYDEYGIDCETMEKIIKSLIRFTPTVKAGLSGEEFHAFIDEEKGFMIVKEKSK